MRILTIIVIFIFHFFPMLGQNFIWGKKVGGISSAGVRAYKMQQDGQGNIYTIGYFAGRPDFDPGYLTDTLIGRGFEDAYIQKLSSSGNFEWVTHIGGPGSDQILAISVDSHDNIVVAGTFEDSVDFDPGPGVFNLYAANNTSSTYILKLDPMGNFIWAKRFEGNSLASISSISHDVNQSIYLTGSFEDSLDFDPGLGSNVVAAQGLNDGFVCKLNSNGNFSWVKTFAGTKRCNPKVLKIDQDQNIVSTGTFSGSIDLNPGPNVATFSSTGNFYYDVYVSKLDTLGNFVWARQLNCPGPIVGNDMEIDLSNNIVIGGNFEDSVDFDPGPIQYIKSAIDDVDIFILKLNALGNFVWAKTQGGNNWDYCLGIALDNANNVLTTGAFNATPDFDPGPGISQLVGLGSLDSYVSKLDSNGNFVWVHHVGGGSYIEGMDIITDSFNNIYTCGYFRAAINFIIGNGNYGYLSTPISSGVGSLNQFVFKLGPCIPDSSTLIITECDSLLWNVDSITYKKSGIYSYSISKPNGCDSVCMINLTIDSTTSVTSTISALGSYTWAVNGMTYTNSGTYYDTTINTNGCKHINILLLTITPNSVPKSYHNNDIEVYPNPSNGKFTLILNDAFGEKGNYKIYNMLGMLISDCRIDGRRKYNFNIGASSGIYILELQDPNDRVLYKRLMKL